MFAAVNCASPAAASREPPAAVRPKVSGIEGFNPLKVSVSQNEADYRVFVSTLQLGPNWLKGFFYLGVRGSSGFLLEHLEPSSLELFRTKVLDVPG